MIINYIINVRARELGNDPGFWYAGVGIERDTDFHHATVSCLIRNGIANFPAKIMKIGICSKSFWRNVRNGRR